MQTRHSNMAHTIPQIRVQNQGRKFELELADKFSKKLLKFHHKNLFTQNFWTMSKGIYLEKNWNNIMPFIVSSDCKALELEKNDYPEILLQVSHPAYTRLRCINLERNFIANIEILASANMDSLQQLNLNKNMIVTAKSLNKTRWPQFNKLSLQSNPINKLEFSRMKIGSNQCEFNLENNEEECRQQDCAPFTAKIESNSTKEMMVKINSKKRIIQTKIHESILKKTITLKVRFYEWQ